MSLTSDQKSVVHVFDMVVHVFSLTSEIKKMFTVFDKDGNGKICATELGKVMRSLGQKPTDKELQKLIADGDKDGTCVSLSLGFSSDCFLTT